MRDLGTYDYLVVGAGFFGATVAERLASTLGKRVLVIDKRNHIGGNSYSYSDSNTGIEVHKYGPHIFHTSNKEVWKYINRFSAFNLYRHKVYASYLDDLYPIPINLDTINRFYNRRFNSQQAAEFLGRLIQKHYTTQPRNFEQLGINCYGRDLYNAFIKGYSEKQWGTELTNLPPSTINRLTLRLDRNDRYFSDRYEGIPVDGYGRLFEKMLSHQNIDVHLGVDFFKIKTEIPSNITIIYSGPIDRYFEYQHGILGWRTLKFEKQTLHKPTYQGLPVINYPEKKYPFTRIHEFKYYAPDALPLREKTVIFREFSCVAGQDDDPYYPINTPKDRAIMKKYLGMARNENKTIFGGRLGRYSYLNMDQVISMALKVVKKTKLKT